VPARFEINRVMGEWLEGVRPWQYFSTWTFAQPVTVAGAMHQAREHVYRLENLVNGRELPLPSKKNAWGYLDEFQTSFARKRVEAFIGVEEGRAGGLVHLHALVYGVASLDAYCGTRLTLRDQVRQGRPMTYDEQVRQGRTPVVGPRAPRWPQLSCCMVHAWPRGIARVLSYDPTKGAAYYVSDYVTKRLAEWELVGFTAANSS